MTHTREQLDGYARDARAMIDALYQRFRDGSSKEYVAHGLVFAWMINAALAWVTHETLVHYLPGQTGLRMGLAGLISGVGGLLAYLWLNRGRTKLMEVGKADFEKRVCAALDKDHPIGLPWRSFLDWPDRGRFAPRIAEIPAIVGKVSKEPPVGFVAWTPGIAGFLSAGMAAAGACLMATAAVRGTDFSTVGVADLAVAAASLLFYGAMAVSSLR